MTESGRIFVNDIYASCHSIINEHVLESAFFEVTLTTLIPSLTGLRTAVMRFPRRERGERERRKAKPLCLTLRVIVREQRQCNFGIVMVTRKIRTEEAFEERNVTSKISFSMQIVFSSNPHYGVNTWKKPVHGA